MAAADWGALGTVNSIIGAILYEQWAACLSGGGGVWLLEDGDEPIRILERHGLQGSERWVVNAKFGPHGCVALARPRPLWMLDNVSCLRFAAVEEERHARVEGDELGQAYPLAFPLMWREEVSRLLYGRVRAGGWSVVRAIMSYVR